MSKTQSVESEEKVRSSGFLYVRFHLELLKSFVVFSIAAVVLWFFLVTFSRKQPTSAMTQATKELNDLFSSVVSVLLTFTIVRLTVAMRSQVRNLYLGPNSHPEEELAAKTLLLTGLEALDLSGDDFKRLVRHKTHRTLRSFGATGFVTLPTLTEGFDMLKVRTGLKAMFEALRREQPNCLTNTLLPLHLKDESHFAFKRMKLLKQIERVLLKQVLNSGYVLLFFKSHRGMMEFRECMDKWSH